eukprot:scaffold86886_cov39-Phaeocystis_antarctica.AAC.2
MKGGRDGGWGIVGGRAHLALVVLEGGLLAHRPQHVVARRVPAEHGDGVLVRVERGDLALLPRVPQLDRVILGAGREHRLVRVPLGRVRVRVR